VPPDEQEKYDPLLSNALGWNCIQRRNFGLLWAKDMNADVVALVDDANIPLPGWGQDLFVGKQVEVDFYTTDLPAFDPIGATNYGHLWHRGYPLQLLRKRRYDRKTRKLVYVDVQADLWNGDPDVDAVCRLEHAPKCDFDPRFFPMASNKMGPFNSQNTFMSRKVLRDFFVLPFVTLNLFAVRALCQLNASLSGLVHLGVARLFPVKCCEFQSLVNNILHRIVTVLHYRSQRLGLLDERRLQNNMRQWEIDPPKNLKHKVALLS